LPSLFGIFVNQIICEMHKPRSESIQSTKKPDDLWLYLQGGFLIYILVYQFMKKIMDRDESKATMVATGLALLGIYTGTIVSKILNPKGKNIPSWALVLSITVLVCLIAWLFIFSQFTLPSRNPLNLLLFGLPFLVTSILTGAIIQTFRSTIENNLQ
jgi:hypothetical protein